MHLDRAAGAKDQCTDVQWLGPGCGREAPVVTSEDKVAERAWGPGDRKWDFCLYCIEVLFKNIRVKLAKILGCWVDGRVKTDVGITLRNNCISSWHVVKWNKPDSGRWTGQAFPSCVLLILCVSTCICVHACVCVYSYVYMYVSVFECTCVHMCMHVQM